MKRHFLDLFSGLGGASEAFAQDPSNWNVLRIDNNPLLSEVPNTVIMDLREITPQRMHENYIDCIWASPPCLEFSGGFASPKSIASRSPGGLESYEPNMEFLELAIEIIEIVKPKFWIIENVIGSIRYFKEYLGAPKQIIGPYVLWGNFPELYVNHSLLKSKKNKDTGSYDPLRSNRRAKVDFEISRALKESIENQKSILDFN